MILNKMLTFLLPSNPVLGDMGGDNVLGDMGGDNALGDMGGDNALGDMGGDNVPSNRNSSHSFKVVFHNLQKYLQPLLLLHPAQL